MVLGAMCLQKAIKQLKVCWTLSKCPSKLQVTSPGSLQLENLPSRYSALTSTST